MSLHERTRPGLGLIEPCLQRVAVRGPGAVAAASGPLLIRPSLMPYAALHNGF
jgi:hypothetical protein